MSDTLLKTSRFRAEREADWQRLERLLTRFETKSATSLSDEELIAAPVLYRAALSALSVARATSLDRNLVDYLEALSARAYFMIYGARVSAAERILAFFARDWPRAAQALWRETLFCVILTALGAAAAYTLTVRDSNWYDAFVPQALVEGRNPGATTAALRATLFNADPHINLSVFATFLFSHNAGIALLAFALGFAFGVPSILLVIENGCTLGAFLSVFIAHGLGYEAGGWLLIHGVTELFAIMLAGAAGLRIGRTIAFPGERSRLDAVAIEGMRAATLMAGVLVMLCCAGLLEGIGRQLIQSTVIRYTIAATSALFWLAYLYWPRRARPTDG